jgi:hypothetical protein
MGSIQIVEIAIDDTGDRLGAGEVEGKWRVTGQGELPVVSSSDGYWPLWDGISKSVVGQAIRYSPEAVKDGILTIYLDFYDRDYGGTAKNILLKNGVLKLRVPTENAEVVQGIALGLQSAKRGQKPNKVTLSVLFSTETYHANPGVSVTAATQAVNRLASLSEELNRLDRQINLGNVTRSFASAAAREASENAVSNFNKIKRVRDSLSGIDALIGEDDQVKSTVRAFNALVGDYGSRKIDYYDEDCTTDADGDEDCDSDWAGAVPALTDRYRELLLPTRH